MWPLLPQPLPQPTSGTTNEEWSCSRDEQRDGNEKVGERDRDTISESKARNAVPRNASNNNERGENSGPLQEFKRFLASVSEQTGAILASIGPQLRVKQVLHQLAEPAHNRLRL